MKMKIKILLSTLLAVIFATTISYDVSAQGRGRRGYRPRVMVSVYPPRPAYYAPPPPVYCAPPPVAYYRRPCYPQPRRYAYAYRGYRNHGGRYNRCR